MAGALDSPDTRTARMPIREAKRCGVTASPRRHHRLRNHRPRAGGNDRQCVPIAVRVDTDHIVQLVCKHPDRSSDRLVASVTPA